MPLVQLGNWLRANVDPDGVVVVPASSVAASLHLVLVANALACIVAHFHRLLVCDIEVAAIVMASAGGFKHDTAFEIH